MTYKLYFIDRKTNVQSKGKKVIFIQDKARLEQELKNLLEAKLHRFRRELIVVKAYCQHGKEVVQKAFTTYNQLREYVENQDHSIGWW